MLRRLTDRGTEYCGKVEQHDYQLYLAINDIAHTKTKAMSPQTNGICGRVHKSILQDFYQTILFYFMRSWRLLFVPGAFSVKRFNSFHYIELFGGEVWEVNKMMLFLKCRNSPLRALLKQFFGLVKGLPERNIKLICWAKPAGVSLPQIFTAWSRVVNGTVLMTR
ncbi:hypothetical protein SY86_00680 [Erwinia tracheiphila]|uniref:Integrase catalytic domain-containing protein n=1 Tax=Erwinia tracheiphila TaxID=65700 RepID=A0A0M2KM60_9GAMM|nr:hypothetical protein SY86_00680 [Erwinia tracheiphila]